MQPSLSIAGFHKDLQSEARGVGETGLVHAQSEPSFERFGEEPTPTSFQKPSTPLELLQTGPEALLLPWSGRKSKAQLQHNVSGASGNTRNMLVILENHTQYTIHFYDSNFINGRFLDEMDFELSGMRETGFTVRNAGLRLKGVTGSLFLKLLKNHNTEEEKMELYFSNSLIGVNNGSFFFLPSKSPISSCERIQLSLTVGTGNSGSIWRYSVREISSEWRSIEFNNFGVVTFNVASFPPAFPTIKEPKERCQKIANYFLNRKDVHLLCFQEAWFTQSRKELMNTLIHSYPFIVDIGQVGMITFQTNGLLLASKLPVLRSRFFEFGNCIGADNLAKKGLLAAELCLPGHYPYRLCCFVTHLQADPDPSPPWLLVTGNKLEKCKETRLKQCQMIKEYIRSFVDPTAYTKVILTGDFNVPGETDEYFRMIEILGKPTDTFRMLNPDHPGHTWDCEKNKLITNDNTKARYDYVFEFFEPPAGETNDSRLLPECIPNYVDMIELDWSDHFGLQASFDLRPRLL